MLFSIQAISSPNYGDHSSNQLNSIRVVTANALRKPHIINTNFLIIGRKIKQT
jgi:hypothetical protein